MKLTIKFETSSDETEELVVRFPDDVSWEQEGERTYRVADIMIETPGDIIETEAIKDEEEADLLVNEVVARLSDADLMLLSKRGDRFNHALAREINRRAARLPVKRKKPKKPVKRKSMSNDMFED
jgi:hypothetical protein